MIGQILSYSLTSSIVLACLYLVYRLCLRHTTLFSFNRACIISIYALSAVAPFITFSLTRAASSPTDIEAEQMTVVAAALSSEAATSLVRYIVRIYAAVAALICLRFIADTVYLGYLRFTAKEVDLFGLNVLVHSNKHMAPFSWGGRIFIPSTYADEDRDKLRMIIDHELAHLRNRHWLDLLVSNAFVALQWYNPAAWFLHNEIISVHEYEADRNVLRQNTDPIEYQLLLIEKTAGNRFHAMADSLNHSSLNNRITMMMKSQTKSCARLRALAMLPAMTVALCLINSSCVKDAQDAVSEDVAQSTEIPAPVPAEAAVISDEPAATAANEESADAQDLEKIESMPEYPGGLTSFYNEVASLLRWDESMKEGRVVVQFTIDADGNMTDQTLIKGLSPENDKAAIEAIKKIKTKWIPAKSKDGSEVSVTYAIPISFKME